MAGPVLSPLEQQVLNAKTQVRAEMPDVANAPIEPMGWLDRLIAAARGKMEGATTMALAHPSAGGSVAYSPENIGAQGETGIADTFAHELTHVRQARRDYGGKGIAGQILQRLADKKESRLPYGQQSSELEAFQTEGDRAVAQGREPNPTPNFSGPGFREKGDVVLPEPDLELLQGSDPGTQAENIRTLTKMGYTPADAVKRAQREAKRNPKIVLRKMS